MNSNTRCNCCYDNIFGMEEVDYLTVSLQDGVALRVNSDSNGKPTGYSLHDCFYLSAVKTNGLICPECTNNGEEVAVPVDSKCYNIFKLEEIHDFIQSIETFEEEPMGQRWGHGPQMKN